MRSSACMDEFSMEEPAYHEETNGNGKGKSESYQKSGWAFEEASCTLRENIILRSRISADELPHLVMTKLVRLRFGGTWYSRSQGSDICKLTAIFSICKWCMQVARGCTWTNQVRSCSNYHALNVSIHHKEAERSLMRKNNRSYWQWMLLIRIYVALHNSFYLNMLNKDCI